MRGLAAAPVTRLKPRLFPVPASSTRNHDISASARFLYRSFSPCTSLRAVLFEYDRIRHLIDHRPFRVHRQDRADSLESVFRSIDPAVYIIVSFNVREIMRNMKLVILPSSRTIAIDCGLKLEELLDLKSLKCVLRVTKFNPPFILISFYVKRTNAWQVR